MVCPNRKVSFLPQSDQWFRRKMQKSQITYHVRCYMTPTVMQSTFYPIATEFCRMTPFRSWLDQPFLHKERTYEITIYVPLTRVKEAPPSLTPMDRVHLWWLSAHQVWVKSVHWFGQQPWLKMLGNGLRDSLPTKCRIIHACEWHRFCPAELSSGYGRALVRVSFLSRTRLCWIFHALYKK